MAKKNIGLVQRIRVKVNSASSFAPELYDFLRFHGSQHTKLGRVANFLVKLAYKTVSLLKKMQRKAAQEKFQISSGKSSDSTRFPWLLPLTHVSADKGRKILIVAETSLTQCTKYRVTQKVEMLEYLGLEVTVCDWRESSDIRQHLQTHGLIIFYRVPAFPSVKEILSETQRLNLETFFDVDDLIFDMEEFSKNSNILSLSREERDDALVGVALYRYTLENCKHAIASTPILAEFMKRYCKGAVYIIENALDKQMFDLLKTVQKANLEKNQGVVTIGYGSGTKTHDADFEVCSIAILRILEKYPFVRLAVHGHLALASEFDAVKSQVLRVPFLKSDDYYKALSTFDINLAPLEDSVFNDAKSNIKFLEAAIFSVPTVASPAASFRQVVTNTVNGYLCYTDTEWFEALSSLVESKSLREEVGRRAFLEAKATYHFEQVANLQLTPLLENHLPKKAPKRRVLVTNILFRPTAFGGATLVTEELAKRIHAMPDTEVAIFTGFWGDGGAGVPFQQVIRYEVLGMQVFAVRFPEVNTPELDYKNGQIAAAFYDVIKSFEPDIVHIHSIQQLGASLAEPCQKLRIPYVVTMHDAWWLCERQFMVNSKGEYCGQTQVDPRVCASTCTSDSSHTFSRFYYLRDVLNQAELLLCPSSFQRELYISNGFDATKVVVNKNGILPVGDEWGRAESRKLRMLYLGGNAPHKGYAWLKEIFESIDLSGFSLHLADIQRTIGKPSIYETDWNIKGDLIVSHGFDSQGIDEFFSNIDVLLLPSQCKESFGLTVREALIRDVWVITTDSGGASEDIVEGVNGNVVAMGDQHGFRTAVIEKIKMGGGTSNPYKDHIRLYDVQADELSAFYDKAIEAHRGE